MRVVVFGSGGMLGVAVVDAMRAAGRDVVAVPHHESHKVFANRIERVSRQCSITNMDALSATFRSLAPEVVVNCAGTIPVSGRPAAEMVEVNALGPHVLASVCAAYGARLIHISTDCVFGPDSAVGPHVPTDRADASDIYGRSKALGEVDAPHIVTNIRTSFIGPQHGLWAWLAQQPPGAEVEGWTAARWSGSTVWAVARSLAAMPIEHLPTGTFHLATFEWVTKYSVVGTLVDSLGLDLRVRPVSRPVVNRAMQHSDELGPRLQSFDEAMRDFVRSNS